MHWYLQRFGEFPFLALKNVVLCSPDAVRGGCLCMLLQQRNSSVTCLVFCIFLPSFSSYIRTQTVGNSSVRKLALNHCQTKCQQKVYASLMSIRTLPAQHPADIIWDAATDGNGSSVRLVLRVRSYSLGLLLCPSPLMFLVTARPAFSEGGKVCHQRSSVPTFPKGDGCWECK